MFGFDVEDETNDPATPFEPLCAAGVAGVNSIDADGGTELGGIWISGTLNARLELEVIVASETEVAADTAEFTS